MATKTFKIGLSATDKQNMAQDVYERVLALTFSEYNSSNTYNTGDFVVYNDTLYQCLADNVTGTWDSTKWQQATLQDLLDDVEGAVASVADKANVDGNYPTMTVGVADQLSPYDEESGDDQDEPFSFQATGTANGTQPDFSTGSIALMKEKQGNTVVVNQAIQNGDFSNGTTGWNTNNSTLTVSNGVASFTATAQNGRFSQSFTSNLIQGHKYLLHAKLSEQLNVNIYSSGNSQYIYNFNNFAIFEVNYSPNQIRFYDGRSSDWSTITVEDVFLIDLTQWFNGDIPQDLLDNPENFFRYYQGSLAYNTGELVNANGRYIKCIGRNQWDEETELGGISWSAGTDYAANDKLRTKNYTEVIPNTVYHALVSGANMGYDLHFYDANKQHIDAISCPASKTFTTPANAKYIRFAYGTAYGTTYRHDTTISIYYEDESGYDQYYPYEVLTNNDTGTEQLLAFDTKDPDGTIHRNTGTIDLSSLSWTNDGSFYIANITGIARKAFVKLVALNYPLTQAIMWSNVQDGEIGKLGADNISVRVKTNSSPTGTCYYELETPTTEQGTTFSPNLIIDDFGTMDFSGTNGVPQGNLIFYPVDYKAFVDTLYDYTEGTPSNIALKSDLSADKTELQGVDIQLLANIGGALRHQLADNDQDLDFADTDWVDLGSLTWTYDTITLSYPVFYASVSGRKGGSTNFISSIYKNVGSRTNLSANNMEIATWNTTSSDIVAIRNTAYTDATAFKNAMKGILLAYEKAS